MMAPLFFMRRTTVRALAIVLLALQPGVSAVVAARGPVEVVPVRLGEGAVALNGEWKFKYVPALDAGADEGFTNPSYDVSGWARMPVPGNWELHGFAEPQYDAPKEGTGLYRRVFRSEKSWQGQRVFLRFEGVLFGMSVWVNGHAVGEWGSSFNPVTFDITDALNAGESENTLAVRVTTRSKGWDFDTMDCWGLSGIFRDVMVFAVPAVHFSDYTAATTLQPDGSADLAIAVVTTGPADVAARLFAPDGKPVDEASFSVGTDGHGAAKVNVKRPTLWSAESPALYRLELDLLVNGRAVQRYHDRVGLRQVTIENGVFKLNGTAIKARGVDHHDMWPQEGRVSTEPLMRRDLELMRQANINFIRTSHYPPHPRLIELCDELGIYVECEVPFIHGRQHHADPSYQEVLDARARATVMRDKNRASVILWSIGNENHITELGLNTGRLVKRLDPTRPITYPTMGSYFRTNYEAFPAFVDLYAPHYPSTKTIDDYAARLTRPLLFTEYSHQRGLARGGAGVQDMWERMYRNPHVLGGAIWQFEDQGILRTAPDLGAVEHGDLMVWLDEHRYFDTHGYYGVDGLVYSDRTPQVDYWQVRKVYSPVQIRDRALPLRAGRQTLSFAVENRFDFRTLNGVTLRWALKRNRATVEHGGIGLTAKPHASETVNLAVNAPAGAAGDVFALEIECTDQTGMALYERSIRLDYDAAPSRWQALVATLTAARPVLEPSAASITVRHTNYTLQVQRDSGRMSILDATGALLVADFGPHTARKLLINDLGKKREGEATHWQGELLTAAAGSVHASARETNGGVEVEISGRYARPGVAREYLEGKATLQCTPGGAIEISYRYVPVNATGSMVEAGVAMSVPVTLTAFRWVGQGPYSAYPGKDRLAEFGLFQLDRNDLYFPGNRRQVDVALLAAPTGAGVLMGGDRLTVSVENRDAGTIFSHLALVPGEALDVRAGEENVELRSEIKASSIKAIEGGFSLVPLGRQWPELLTRWFGQPNETVKVFRPFLRSYDQ